MLNKKFQEQIVQQYCTSDRQSISEELFPSTEKGRSEGDVLGKDKTGRECYRENKKKRSNMRSDGDAKDGYHLFFQNKIIKDEVEQDIENSVGAPCG